MNNLQLVIIIIFLAFTAALLLMSTIYWKRWADIYKTLLNSQKRQYDKLFELNLHLAEMARYDGEKKCLDDTHESEVILKRKDES